MCVKLLAKRETNSKASFRILVLNTLVGGEGGAPFSSRFDPMTIGRCAAEPAASKSNGWAGLRAANTVATMVSVATRPAFVFNLFHSIAQRSASFDEMPQK